MHIIINLTQIVLHIRIQVLESDIVDFVEEDRVIFGGSSSKTVASWGVDRIDSSKAELNQRFNLSCDLSGKGVDVYVLDTGINYNHKEFSGKVRYASELVYIASLTK